MADPHIGTLAERSLHAALKDWCAQPGDRREVKVDGYVIDLVRGALLIEIQTRGFASIRRKLSRLTQDHPLRLVFPIAAERWIVKLAADGQTLVERRKSPRRGRVEHVFAELVSIPDLITRATFSLEVLLTREEEIRRDDGLGSWRRKRWSVIDRRLIEVADRVTFSTPDDFRALLPPDLPDPFTNRVLARAMGQPAYLAAKMTYCLSRMGAIRHVGKQGKAYLYSLG
jgi:hypothetical protein